jgi:hypothetical protein
MAGIAAIKKAYRLFNWISLIGLVLVIILVMRKPAVPDLPYDPGAAKRLEQKFAAADQAKAAGETTQVEINRTELNSYLAQNLQLEGSAASASAATSIPAPSTGAIPGGSALNGAGSTDPMTALASADPQTIDQVQSSVKDVKIDMDGDLIKAYVIFDFHGKDLSLELDGHLGAQDGYLKFQPVAGKLGSLPLPQSTLDSAVEKLMSSPESRERLKLPDDVSDIHIADGQAVLSYK